MSSTVGTVVALDDIFAEGTDGQYVEVDLTDGSGAAIDTATIVSITGTLRSRDTEAALFEDADMVASGRSSYPGAAGRVRITFTAADMAASGSRELQTRDLTLSITHSVNKVFHCGVAFGLLNQRDVG